MGWDVEVGVEWSVVARRGWSWRAFVRELWWSFDGAFFWDDILLASRGGDELGRPKLALPSRQETPSPKTQLMDDS
jgi:hypothetical protein